MSFGETRLCKHKSIRTLTNSLLWNRWDLSYMTSFAPLRPGIGQSIHKVSSTTCTQRRETRSRNNVQLLFLEKFRVIMYSLTWALVLGDKGWLPDDNPVHVKDVGWGWGQEPVQVRNLCRSVKVFYTKLGKLIPAWNLCTVAMSC